MTVEHYIWDRLVELSTEAERNSVPLAAMTIDRAFKALSALATAPTDITVLPDGTIRATWPSTVREFNENWSSTRHIGFSAS